MKEFVECAVVLKDGDGAVEPFLARVSDQAEHLVVEGKLSRSGVDTSTIERQQFIAIYFRNSAQMRAAGYGWVVDAVQRDNNRYLKQRYGLDREVVDRAHSIIRTRNPAF